MFSPSLLNWDYRKINRRKRILKVRFQVYFSVIDWITELITAPLIMLVRFVFLKTGLDSFSGGKRLYFFGMVTTGKNNYDLFDNNSYIKLIIF